MDYTDYAAQGQTQLMTLLKQKLSEKQWKEADELTKIIMIKTSNQKDGSYLSLDIGNFPSGVLNEIDELWQRYSSYHFGFTAQKRILRSRYEIRPRNYQDFITNVGWYKKDSWLNYSDLSFAKSAPEGHLPYCGRYFWEKVYAPEHSPSLSTHNHQHYHAPHYHAPHGHNSGGEGAAGAAALGAGIIAAAPWVLGAAALAGAVYLIHHVATKEERENQERLERIEAEKQAKQRLLEEENKVQKNIESLLRLV